MSSRVRTKLGTAAVAALCILGVTSTLACSAILDIGDWSGVDSTDAAESETGPHPDASTPKETGPAVDAAHPDATLDATPDQQSPMDVTTHDAGSDAAHEAAHEAGTKADASDGGAGSVVTVTPSSLLFGTAGGDGGVTGFVACGSPAPASQQFTISNAGAAALMYSMAFASGGSSRYSWSIPNLSANDAGLPCSDVKSPCVIAGKGAADGSVTVTVIPPSVPSNAGITTYGDTLYVFTSAPGDTGHAVQLGESSYGAILQLSQGDVNFGAVPTSTVATQSLSLLNSGNAPLPGAMLSIVGDAGSEFQVSPVSLTLPAETSTGAGTVSFSAAFTPGSDTSPVSGSVAIAVPPDSLCGPLPNELTLEGTGSAAAISVAPASLNFNSGASGNGGIGVSCGSTGPTLGVGVGNQTGASVDLTGITFGQGTASNFSVVGTPPTSVATGGTAMIMFAPKPVASSSAPGVDLSDTVTITTSAPGDVAHVITLHETTAGAAVSVNPTTLAFSSTPENTTSTSTFTVTNAGNLGAPITLTAPSDPAFTFSGLLPLSPSSSVNASATFAPSTDKSYSATASLVIASSVPLCSVPNEGSSNYTIPLTLSGAGTLVNYFSVSQSTIGFGDNTCNGATPTPESVTLSNASSTSVPWSAGLSGSGASFFTLSPSSGPVMGGSMATPGTASFTVTPIALPPATGTGATLSAPGPISATITVLIDPMGPNPGTFSIQVSETPIGAFPSWSSNPVTIATTTSGGVIGTGLGATTSGSQSFALDNAASAPTSFNLAFSASSEGFTLAPMSGSSSNTGPLGLNVSYSAGNSMKASTMIVAAPTGGGTLCTALPPLKVTTTSN